MDRRRRTLRRREVSRKIHLCSFFSRRERKSADSDASGAIVRWQRSEAMKKRNRSRIRHKFGWTTTTSGRSANSSQRRAGSCDCDGAAAIAEHKFHIQSNLAQKEQLPSTLSELNGQVGTAEKKKNDDMVKTKVDLPFPHLSTAANYCYRPI